MDFLADMGSEYKILRPIFANREQHCLDRGFELNYKASYWTPPLAPQLAFDLERCQIEDDLDLPALVSITDHDTIEAPVLLRGAEATASVPISVEWTAPYRDSVFHLGIHNLPNDTAAEWMATFAAFTAEPSRVRLKQILAELHALPDTLIVFNHPVWDLNKVGPERHRFCIHEFMTDCAEFIHAMELNGLRGWKENREVRALAGEWNQLLISGGDRHGVQPNANTNLTNATSFVAFVHEVRRERISHVHFMASYEVPWKYRVFESTLDVIRHYPEFPEGTQNWDDRVFHPDENGVARPISQLWPGDGRAPIFARYVLGATRLLGKRPLSSSLRLAWNDRHEKARQLANGVGMAALEEFLQPSEMVTF